MEKEDLLFFYFLHLFANNVSIMKRINRFIKEVEFSNAYLDFFFGYIFITIGLQAEFSLRFVRYYLHEQNVCLN